MILFIVANAIAGPEKLRMTYCYFNQIKLNTSGTLIGRAVVLVMHGILGSRTYLPMLARSDVLGFRQ